MMQSHSVAVHVLSADPCLVQSESNIVSDMAGEKVILSIENGKYYNLGTLGGHIWDILKERTTVSRLIDLLMQEYEVDRAICEEQVLSFLSHLLDEKLILVQE